MSMLRTYSSKIDPLYYAVMLIIPLLLLIVLVLAGGAAFPGMDLGMASALRTVFCILLAFPLWTLIGTWYALDGKSLYVRSGPFRWTIQLSEIHSVSESRDMHSSPALSFDRLRIVYGHNRSILISPREKAVFLRDLEQHLSAARSQCTGINAL